MKNRSEIEAQLRAMLAARAQTAPSSALEAWVNGNIFALSWAADEVGAVTPSEGFSMWLEARPDHRGAQPARKDPSLP